MLARFQVKTNCNAGATWNTVTVTAPSINQLYVNWGKVKAKKTTFKESKIKSL